MRRIAVIAVAAALFATTGAVALAADPDPGETRVLNEAQLWQRDLLTEPFVGRFGSVITSVDDITVLRSGDTVIGWGAIFKLLQLAEASSSNLAQLLGEIAGDEDQRGWAFGYRFKILAGDSSSSSGGDERPKNFGQLMKEHRELEGNQGKKP